MPGAPEAAELLGLAAAALAHAPAALGATAAAEAPAASVLLARARGLAGAAARLARDPPGCALLVITPLPVQSQRLQLILPSLGLIA